MTLVSFANESDERSVGVPSLLLPSSKAGSRRFNLKKRSHDQNKTGISSYNSDFLSGLFADVARASQSQDEDDEVALATSSTTTEDRLDHSLPVKRSRVSLTKSFSRSGRSFKNLSSVASPVGVDAFLSEASSAESFNFKSMEPSCSLSMERINSLHFQLNCVDPSPSPKSVKSVVDIIDMAFPHLPATVSDSSCSRSSHSAIKQQQDLTQASDQQVSDSETSFTSSSATTTGKESYGWFVELDSDEVEDDHQDLSCADPYKRTISSTDLAFSASTAPKRVSNDEAEVAWAKAADTVDDVLGDFF